MSNALVVYAAESAATRWAAEEIARGLAGAGRVVPTLVGAAALGAERVERSDLIVLGVPASARAARREVREMEGRLPRGLLDRKLVSLFDAGPPGQHGAGARTVRELLAEDDPALHLAAPGISVGVDGGLRGLPEAEQARCRQFGAYLAGIVAASGTL
jgi:flavorubredoxin